MEMRLLLGMLPVTLFSFIVRKSASEDGTAVKSSIHVSDDSVC